LQCVALYFTSNLTQYFEVTSKTPITNPNGRYLKHKINKILEISRALQVHMSVVFVSNTFPSVSLALVQIQMEFETLDDFEKFHKAEVSNFGRLDAK
jgi:hypothetical protein